MNLFERVDFHIFFYHNVLDQHWKHPSVSRSDKITYVNIKSQGELFIVTDIEELKYDNRLFSAPAYHYVKKVTVHTILGRCWKDVSILKFRWSIHILCLSAFKSKASSFVVVNTYTAGGQFLNWTSNTNFIIAMLGSKKIDNI